MGFLVMAYIKKHNIPFLLDDGAEICPKSRTSENLSLSTELCYTEQINSWCDNICQWNGPDTELFSKVLNDTTQLNNIYMMWEWQNLCHHWVTTGADLGRATGNIIWILR
jgi:hypothetical protein